MLAIVLWAVGIVLLVALTTAMLVRRTYRVVPIFFSYVVFMVVSELVLVVFYRTSATAYFYGYWIREIVQAPLQFGVVYEVILSVFSSYPAIRRLLRICAAWAFSVLVLLGLFVAISFPANGRNAMMNDLLAMDRSFRMIDVGLLLLLFLFASFLRMRWPHYALGIAIGLGLASGVELAELALRTTHDISWAGVLEFVNSAAYVLGLVLWNVTFVFAEKKAPVVSTRPSQLEEWNRTLEALLAQ